MARVRSFDTAEALARSMDVFWERGYEATSIEDLTKVTGLSRSSIYSAFGSKRGLFDAVMDVYLDEIGAMLSPLEQGVDGISDILRFFEGWRERMSADVVDGSLGCLMANTLAERGHIDPLVAASGAQYLERLRSAFHRSLLAAAEKNEVSADATSRHAEVLMLMTTGLFVASRGQSPEWIESLLDTAVAEVEAWRS